MAETTIIQKSKLPDGVRLDPEYYRPEYIKMESMLVACNSKKLKEISDKVVSFGAYSLTNQVLYQDTGIPYLRCIDIKDGRINFANVLFIDKKTHNLLWKSEIHPSHVLLTMSGSVGNAAVASTKLSYPINSNQDIAKITLNKEIDPYYFVVFLNSKYGKFQTTRSTVGSIQQHLFLWQIEELLIPVIDIQHEIADLAIKAENAINSSLQSFKEAILILENELGLRKVQEQRNSTRNLSEVLSSKRIDAEFYQPHYYKIIDSLKKYGSKKFSKIIALEDKNIIPELSKSYKYIELSNISENGFIDDYMLEIGENLPSRARRVVKMNNVLISSIEGSLSSCALVTKEFHDSLCSTGFYVITSEILNPETLLVLFKSMPFQHLLKRCCTGTILTAINRSALEDIEIPIIPTSVQNLIAKKVQESYMMRNEAKNLLENAKKRVEHFIENKYSRQ